MFSADDANDILSIVVGGQGTEDHLAWNLTKNGQFSVRSAYHLRIALNRARNRRPGPSSSAATHRGWLGLWDSQAPGKAKIHMWRLMRNGLVVGAELRRRTIKAGVFCVA